MKHNNFHNKIHNCQHVKLWLKYRLWKTLLQIKRVSFCVEKKRKESLTTWWSYVRCFAWNMKILNKLWIKECPVAREGGWRKRKEKSPKILWCIACMKLVKTILKTLIWMHTVSMICYAWTTWRGKDNQKGLIEMAVSVW